LSFASSVCSPEPRLPSASAACRRLMHPHTCTLP
jgi:hypothetical protein